MTKHLSEDGITARHSIAYYTFLPVVTVAFLIPGLSFLLFIFGEISVPIVILGVNTPVLLCSLYVATLGDYIVPAETYRKYRSGEYQTSDEDGDDETDYHGDDDTDYLAYPRR